MARGFTLTRVLDAPRDLVWRAWTEPDEMARWFHPRGATTPREDVRVDLRVGGSYVYVMVPDGPGDRITTGGTYLEIVEPERLVFTWGHPEAPPGESPVITLTFTSLGDRTEMTFRLQGVAGRAGDGFVHDGWTSVLDVLAETLAQPQPQPQPQPPTQTRTAARASAPGRGTALRMDHVGIVVGDLAAATAFFTALGLEPQGRMPVGGSQVDRIVGLEGVRAEIAMMRTPDGHGRVELVTFQSPADGPGTPTAPAPANVPGLRHLAFEVDDLDAVLGKLRALGTGLVGTVESYGDSYRLCYVRGPEAVIVELAERIGG
jgi:uncharacterized protein YndB with AHSA1/START domain/catechol 2,3-dioxygenase-like lactoylglutathione lyase family enzyme